MHEFVYNGTWFPLNKKEENQNEEETDRYPGLPGKRSLRVRADPGTHFRRPRLHLLLLSAQGTGLHETGRLTERNLKS